jgi:hypothetical protein
LPAGYRPFYSLQDATSTTTGRTADVGVSCDDTTMHIVITGTATVKIEGSEDGLSFTNVSNPSGGYTADTMVVLNHKVPYYRAHVTAYTSGLVTAMVGFGRNNEGSMMNIQEKGIHT